MSYGVTQWDDSPKQSPSRLSEHSVSLWLRPASYGKGSELFVGVHEHSLDSKGRVVLPADFRALVVNKGYVMELDHCLGLWSEEGFKEVSDEIQRQRDAQQISITAFREFFASVSDVKLDSAGRISLPKALLKSQGFKSQVVVAGAISRVEIWPAERYEAQQGTTDAKSEVAAAVRSFL